MDNYEEDYDENDYLKLTPSGFDLLRSKKIGELTDEELLTLRFVDSREVRELPNPTLAELERLIAWYDEILINQALLKLVLNGKCHVDINEDGETVFTLTREGKEYAKKLDGSTEDF